MVTFFKKSSLLYVENVSKTINHINRTTMKKVKHVFGDNVYLITSKSVARNPLFKSNEDLKNFKNLASEYLSPVCEVYGFAHLQNEFQYLIRIKEREELEQFFRQKKLSQIKNSGHDLYSLNAILPPESYKIFSQEVSNLLNKYVKQYNKVHGRSGSLMASRYRKILIESEEEMMEWIERLNAQEELYTYNGEWKVPDDNGLNEEDCLLCSETLYAEDEDEVGEVGEDKRRSAAEICGIKNFIKYLRGSLEKCFEHAVPFSIFARNYEKLIDSYQEKFHCKPPW